ncbi:hypothetical protein Cgig2_008554 [Carnegiea gigantea]|uniref:Uncharacterized protein n=1 Tax=Carnegiea gigantea TaxID=171969 RepID=A0A9Q1GW96_9CARY|nr:hypothetical protein Cgig2_008554 [Carnegiea gigantea]
MEAANSARPIPHFDYVPTIACKPCHRLTRVPSPHHTNRDREVSQSNWNARPRTGNHDRLATATTPLSSRPDQGQSAKSTTTSTPYATHSSQTAWSRPPNLEGKLQATLKTHNARKYCEFHEQNWYTTTKCRELKKALHALVDKGQIDWPTLPLWRTRATQPQPWDEDCSTEVAPTIAGGCTEGPSSSGVPPRLPGVWSPHLHPRHLKGDELNFFGALAFCFDPLALLYVVNAVREVVILLEITCQHHQDHTEEDHAFLVATLVD